MDQLESIQIVLLGNPGCGKTTFCRKSLCLKTNEEMLTAFGMEKGQIIELGNKIDIKMWDTKGKIDEKNSQYILNGCDIVIIIFDISTSKSFEDLRNWVNLVNKFKKEARKYLLAFKSDLEPSKSISTLEDFAQTNNIKLHFGNKEDNSCKRVLSQIVSDFLSFMTFHQIKLVRSNQKSKKGFFSSFFSRDSKSYESEAPQTEKKMQELKKIFYERLNYMAFQEKEKIKAIYEQNNEKIAKLYHECFGEEINRLNQSKISSGASKLQILKAKIVERNNLISELQENNLIIMQKKSDQIKNLNQNIADLKQKLHKMSTDAESLQNNFLSLSGELKNTIDKLKKENNALKKDYIEKIKTLETQLNQQKTKMNQRQKIKTVVIEKNVEDDIFYASSIFRNSKEKLPTLKELICKSLTNYSSHPVKSTTKLYEYDSLNPRRMHPYLQKQSNLLFCFEFKDLDEYLFVFVDAEFTQKNKTKKGSLITVKDSKMQEFFVGENQDKNLWFYNPSFIIFGDYDMLYSDKSGFIKMNNRRPLMVKKLLTKQRCSISHILDDIDELKKSESLMNLRNNRLHVKSFEHKQAVQKMEWNHKEITHNLAVEVFRINYDH